MVFIATCKPIEDDGAIRDDEEVTFTYEATNEAELDWAANRLMRDVSAWSKEQIAAGIYTAFDVTIEVR